MEKKKLSDSKWLKFSLIVYVFFGELKLEIANFRFNKLIDPIQ